MGAEGPNVRSENEVLAPGRWRVEDACSLPPGEPTPPLDVAEQDEARGGSDGQRPQQDIVHEAEDGGFAPIPRARDSTAIPVKAGVIAELAQTDAKVRARPPIQLGTYMAPYEP